MTRLPLKQCSIRSVRLPWTSPVQLNTGLRARCHPCHLTHLRPPSPLTDTPSGTAPEFQQPRASHSTQSQSIHGQQALHMLNCCNKQTPPSLLLVGYQGKKKQRGAKASRLIHLCCHFVGEGLHVRLTMHHAPKIFRKSGQVFRKWAQNCQRSAQNIWKWAQKFEKGPKTFGNGPYMFGNKITPKKSWKLAQNSSQPDQNCQK